MLLYIQRNYKKLTIHMVEEREMYTFLQLYFIEYVIRCFVVTVVSPEKVVIIQGQEHY